MHFFKDKLAYCVDVYRGGLSGRLVKVCLNKNSQIAETSEYLYSDGTDHETRRTIGITDKTHYSDESSEYQTF